jgi:hypothetical protein
MTPEQRAAQRGMDSAVITPWLKKAREAEENEAAS